MFVSEIIPLLHKLFPKTKEEGILACTFFEASIVLLSKSDKDITRKENYRPVYLINTDTKILCTVLEKCI